MTKKTKKKKREAAMLKSLTEGLQQIAQGGDAASVVMNLVDTLASDTPASKPKDPKLTKLQKRNGNLKKQEKTVRTERIKLDREREAIAMLASQNPADPEVTRRSTLLQLRCEALEIRDRTLARERTEINSEFGVFNHRKRSAAKKDGTQNQNHGILQATGTFNASIENSYGSGITGPEHDNNNSTGTIKEKHPFAYNEYRYPTAPPPGPSYDYATNTPAMAAETKTDLSSHQRIHPQRLQHLATNYSESFAVELSMAQSPETVHFSSAFATGSNSINQHPAPVKRTKKMSLSDYTAARIKRNESASSPVAERHDAKAVPSNSRTQGKENMSPDVSTQPLQTCTAYSDTSSVQQSGFNFSSSLVTPWPTAGGNDVQNPVSGSSSDAGEQQPGFNFSSNLVTPRPAVGSPNIQSQSPCSLPSTSAEQWHFNFSSNLFTPESSVGGANIQTQSPYFFPSTSTGAEQSGFHPSGNPILPQPECVKNAGQMPDLVFHAPQVKVEQEGTIWGRRW